MDISFPMLTWTHFKWLMNKLNSPHTKSHCLRNLSVLLETILAGWEDETDYLIEVFQLSLFFFFLFTLWAQCFELDNFWSLMKFLLLLSRLNLALQQKQFVFHEKYLFPLKGSQNAFFKQWKEYRIGINQIVVFPNWSQVSFLLYIQTEFTMM